MKTRILIVDDSRVMRRIIRQELEEAGFDIYEAVDGLDAVEKAGKIQPQLITMDVDMPKMDGFDAVYQIRTELKLMNMKSDKEIPIVFITANDTLEGRRKGFEVGATDFILKPFLKGEVAASVSNLLNSDGSLQGLRVLVAEDSNLSRGIIDSILMEAGVKTVLTVNGCEAFEIMKAEEQNIDLVLTDYMMPEMNGDELCRKIRSELGNKLPIIISAKSESSSMLDLFKAGASDYIVKPFTKEELLARVKVHLESRLLNRRLLKQVYDLKRLGKLKDDLLSITSHDLRSPLNGILGFTDLVMQDKSLSDRNRDFLQNVMDSGDFLLNLINDILDLGRVQSESHELNMLPVSIMDLMESSLNTVRHMASPKGIELVTEILCDEPPLISGDKNALIRIFNNLLSNAIKFTPKNGKVKQIIEETENNRLCISIIDTGIGIPAASIPFLFDKFSKASRPGTAGEKSTGLGLSITKELIERHDGSVEVTSEVEKGTCFKLLFPLQKTAQIDQEKKIPDKNKKTKSQKSTHCLRVLLADDNQMNTKLAHMAMTRKGHDVSSVADGKQAFELYLESLKENEKTFEVIFMDLRMPVMDGIEATEQIRKYETEHEISPVPIIALTAETGDEWKSKALEKGLDGFVSKPINIEQMAGIIQQYGRQ
ncbi:MAG: response regulator [Deltaproteobacteria bacterium]|nr:response regulator [Deltaproteobacteria bacterium]